MYSIKASNATGAESVIVESVPCVLPGWNACMLVKERVVLQRNDRITFRSSGAGGIYFTFNRAMTAIVKCALPQELKDAPSVRGVVAKLEREQQFCGIQGNYVLISSDAAGAWQPLETVVKVQLVRAEPSKDTWRLLSKVLLLDPAAHFMYTPVAESLYEQWSVRYYEQTPPIEPGSSALLAQGDNHDNGERICTGYLSGGH